MNYLDTSEGEGATKSIFWMDARKDGNCWECMVPIEAGERIVWNGNEQRAYCHDCGEEVAGYADPVYD